MTARWTDGGDRRSRLVIMLPLSVLVAASALTTTVALSDLQFAIRSSEGRIVLETAQMIIAALVAYLFIGRVLRTGRRRHQLVALAFTIFALSSALFIVVRLSGALEDGSRTERVAIWAPMLPRIVAASLLAASSLPLRNRPVRRTTGPSTLMSAVVIVGASVVGVSLMSSRLPSGISDELLLNASRLPGTSAHPALQLLQLLLVVLYAAAAIGLVFFRAEPADPFETILIAGFVAASFARLNFYLYPSIYSDVVHVGDLLRLLFFLLLLAGASVEIGRYWQVETEAVALRERERLARELHDGLTQELSFIRSQTAAMSKGTTYPEMIELVADAADRAVVEARALLVAMRGDAHSALREVIAAQALRVAGGGSVAVRIDVPDGLILPGAFAHELGRIVEEATRNAVRHGRPRAIDIGVSVDDNVLTLSISDNGRGFDIASHTPGRQGLRGVRERAELLGGSARITSTPGAGTDVEVVVPQPP